MSVRKETRKIILHCTATPEGKDYTVEWIDKLHKRNGWAMCAYHFIVYRDGTVHRGRPLQYVGAHTTGQNAISVGICYIGGCAKDGRTPKDTRTPAQKKALIELVYYLQQKYKNAGVYPHSAFANKACPSFDVEKWVKDEYEPSLIAEIHCNLK